MKIIEKRAQKVTKMGVWGGSGTEWGPESIQDPNGEKGYIHFGGHFGTSLTSKI